MSKKRKLRVGLIFGGRSGEHEVSLTSASGIVKAMDPDKYDIVPIGITKGGRWLTGENIHQRLLDAAAGHPVLAEVSQQLVPEKEKALALPMAETGPLDVVFPVLHGPFGEDGTVQGFFELVGVPYVGAGVAASAVGMDKVMAKGLFQVHNIPITPYRVVLRRAWQTDPEPIMADCEAAFGYPMFVKPANLGSSVGVHKAKDAADLRAGIEDASQYDRKVLVEAGIDAREIEVSVLGNEDPIASLPGEVISSREFYSYAAKYLDNASTLIIPAELTPAQTQQVRELAVAAFKAIDGAGLARCDFLLEKSSGQFYLNEVNTMPGFTPISMYPKLWEASGLSYSDLIDRLIELALERFEDKQQSKTSFDVNQAE